jgi:predicted nucleotidyltransferase
MQADREKVIENARKYALAVSRYILADKIILYGSYARGTWTKYSDIDIAVIVNRMPDDYLSVAKLLNKMTRDIDFRIEPVILDKNDDRSGFLSSVLLNGLVLFEQGS